METKILPPNKVRWQCRRGMLELDILLISFFDQAYDTLTLSQQEAFIHLLEAPDPDLYQWLMGQDVPENPILKAIVECIRLRMLGTP